MLNKESEITDYPVQNLKVIKEKIKYDPQITQINADENFSHLSHSNSSLGVKLYCRVWWW